MGYNSFKVEKANAIMKLLQSQNLNHTVLVVIKVIIIMLNMKNEEDIWLYERCYFIFR